jgi:hypothetical protein
MMVIRMNALSPMQTPGEAAAPAGNAVQADITKAEALIDALGGAGHQSTAELLHELRRAFPHSPLAFRVRALEALRRR